MCGCPVILNLFYSCLHYMDVQYYVKLNRTFYVSFMKNETDVSNGYTYYAVLPAVSGIDFGRQ